MPPSMFVAVDGRTLEVLDRQLPELAATPRIATFDGRIAIYACAKRRAYRFFWNPAPSGCRRSVVGSTYLAEGQSTGDAPGIMGDWITIQTNGMGGKVPSSAVAINQRDPSK